MDSFNTEYQKSIDASYMAELDKEFGLAEDEGVVEEPAKPSTTEPATQPTQEKPQEQPQEDHERTFMQSVGEFIKELPEQAVGGVFDAVNYAVDAARDIGEAVNIPNYALQLTNEEGKFDPMFLSPEEVEAKGGLKEGILPKIEGAETAAGGFTRAITQFATGFIPVSKGLKAAGLANAIGRGMAAGAVTDAVVMDPHQARLATLMNEVPVLQEVIPDYMADNNPDNESEWEGRIKNVLEGVVVGGAGEVAIGAATKMIKAYKTMAKAPQAAKTAAQIVEDEAGAVVAKAEATAEMVEAIPMTDLDITVEGIKHDATWHTAKNGKTYINHNRINSANDIKKVMQEMANETDLSKTKTTHGEIKKASEKQYKDVSDLLGRDVDRPFTAAEAVAARNIMTTSAEQLTKLAKIAKDPMASPTDMWKFRRSIEVHRAIQDVVLRGRQATAQALGAWRIPSGSSKMRGQAIADIMYAKGMDAKKLASMIDDVSTRGGNVSAVIQKSASQKWMDAYYQVWINGILSGPATHAANIISNTGTSMMAIPEKYVSAAFESMTGSNGYAFKEANARAAGFFSGLSDGFNLMTGKTQNEYLQSLLKQEGRADAISAEAWGKQPDSTIGKGLDYLGRAIGMPGWALEKGDLFFKGLNYRMMLQEKATKTALTEGLTGKAFRERVADLVRNPTEAIHDVSNEFAAYQTFTNTPGEVAQNINKLRESAPGAKYILPFVRTPANILSYGFERTPLAFAMADVRSAIKAGGAQGAEALARISCGSLLMASVVPFVLNGKVTGAGPANYDERRALEQTGWKPYSIKIGDNYVSYERMEPISTLIGYSADIGSIMGQIGEDESSELIAAGMAAFARNLTNKTFLSGAAEFTEVVTSNSPAKWENYTSRFAAGLVQPVYYSAAKKVGNYFDPVKRDFRADDENGYLKQIWARATEAIPGYGQDSPPLRDVWGDEMRYDYGVAPMLEAMTPIKIYKEDKDPVNKMIADNKIPLSLPSRTINGIKLTNKEYSRYSEIAGKMAKRELDDLYASGMFEGITTGRDSEMEAIIHKVINTSRQYARGELIMSNPELEDRIYQNELEKEQKILGGS